MKGIILLFSLVVFFIPQSLAQDMQYVSRRSGDTLFVKDDYEFGTPDVLYLLMLSDSLAPADRVYFLKDEGIYSVIHHPPSSKNYKTVVMGPEQNLKTGSSPVVYPPIITGWNEPGINASGGMDCRKDLLVKNIDLEMGNLTGNNGGWAWFGFGGPNMRLEVDNCIMEHTWWTWVGGPPADESIFFNNCYFVNLDGHWCRRNGGVTDFNNSKTQDTLSVQNCTHVNTQGSLYRFREGYVVDRVIFNHNDFIDCAGYVIMNYGNQTNLSITNNIYVNCQLQDMSAVLIFADAGEVDAWGEPMGLVNVRVDSTFSANIGNHGIYVDRNLVYWDPSLSNIDSILNANSVDNRTDWVSQRITMNTRTDSLFKGLYGPYPRLVNGTWYNKLPNFANTDVLFTTQLAILKNYAIACVDTSYKTPLPSWRQPGNDESSWYIFADFPIPIDLSYTDVDLLIAAKTSNSSIQLPIGDLGWFPTEYATWKAQEAAELAYINIIMIGGESVPTTGQLPGQFQLQQNYPNPFNPTTTIGYQLPAVSHVAIKVFDVLGREVAMLVNERQTAGEHYMKFDASSLPSGVYFYSITTGTFSQVKKMILVK
jgi:hypothetical protein